MEHHSESHFEGQSLDKEPVTGARIYFRCRMSCGGQTGHTIGCDHEIPVQLCCVTSEIRAHNPRPILACQEGCFKIASRQNFGSSH